MSRVIAVVGGTHRGKSTFIKERIKKHPHLVNDVKGEYRGFKRYWPPKPREEFCEIIDQGIKKTVIVMEEASFYLSNRHYSTLAEKILVNKWQSGNTYFLVYHSIRKIPLFVYDYLDGMVLFKTNDILPHIKNHPPEILEAFELVNKESTRDKHFKTFIELDDI